MVNQSISLDGYVLENSGDQNFGTLLFLREIHYVPKFVVEALDGGSENKEYLESEEKVSICRHRALQELDKLGVCDIFKESCYKDFRFKDSKLESFPFKREEFFREELDSFTKFLFKIFSSEIIYLGFNQEAVLHKTAEEKEEKDIYNIYKKEFSKGNRIENISHLVMRRREEVAIKEIERFFQLNNGAYAILLFGAAHNFNNCWSVYPRIYSKDLTIGLV